MTPDTRPLQDDYPMREIMDHTAPNRSEARSPDGSEPSAGVITEERVAAFELINEDAGAYLVGLITQAHIAAAFEAWMRDDFDGLQKHGHGAPTSHPGGEATTPYAQRLAAGLFKYLERVT